MLQYDIHVMLYLERVIISVAGFEGEDQGLVVGDDLVVAFFDEEHEASHG